MSKPDKPIFEDTAYTDDDEKTLDPRGILTNKEFRGAQAKARKRLEAEARKSALASAEDQEYDRLLLENHMVAGGAGDDMVNITMSLVDPDINSCLIVDFKCYYHGFTYTVPRHVAASMNEAMYRLERYQALEMRGQKWKEFYRRQSIPRISGIDGTVIGGSIPMARA